MSNLPCQYLHAPKKRGPKPHADAPTRRNRSRKDCGPAQDKEALSPSSSSMAFYPSTETTLPLQVPYATDQEQAALSLPWTGGTLSNIPIRFGTDINVNIQALHHDLVTCLGSCMPNFTLEQIVTKIFDIYMQSSFPLSPLLHEPSIRSNLALVAPLVRGRAASSSTTGGVDSFSANREHLAKLRLYTLILAVCASTAFLLPPESVHDVALVGHVFLHTSRELLKLYQDLDIERPNSSSLVIRMFQASSLHTDGKICVAWQVLGEALRLAEQMHLYEECSFEGLDPVEARLRRVAFWQLFIMDKHSALLEDRR